MPFLQRPLPAACTALPQAFAKYMPKQPLALARRALTAILIIATGPLGPVAALPAAAQLALPTLGDGSDLTPSEERRLGDRIIRELYRDPDYIDDPVLVEYVQVSSFANWTALSFALLCRILA